ncbi:MAG: class II aldolase/adducin family protein [Candidatus Aminicenantaceae bacterium]
MSKWKAPPELIRLFHSVGRVLLLNDMEDSHSGNIAMLWEDGKGEEYFVITSTGSQKGDLDARQICFLSTSKTDHGYYKASSETDIHARILALPDAAASIHAHTKDLTVMTYDSETKPNQPAPFLPIDPLGYHILGVIPVDWVAVPSGSAEMTKIIPERLRRHPTMLLQGHGTFAKGRNLMEALYRVCLADNSGYVARLAERVGVAVKELRLDIQKAQGEVFAFPPPPYQPEGIGSLDVTGEEEIAAEFRRTGARIFESHLSPFHTGSVSVRGVKTMLFSPTASMPREIGGILREMPLEPQDTDDAEIALHKTIYQHSQFQTVLHCYVPEAEVMSRFVPPGQESPVERIVPIDAEGSFLYLVIPVLPPRFKTATLIRLLHDYKVVVVRGGGVWGVGSQSLSEVLHHPSSVREICLYLFGAMERGLDVSLLEPDQAKNW